MASDLLLLNGISLDRLQNFCLVAAHGGIARATGDDLSRQALISRQIRELEGFFGVELTRRRGKGMEITEAGFELARLARATFEGLGDFKAKAAKEPLDVRIAAGNSIVEWFLIPKLERLGKALPNIRVQLFDLRTAEIIKALTEHTIDIGIVRNTGFTAPLKFKSAAEIGYRFFVPKNLTDKSKNPVEIPMALSLGGEFHERTMREAKKAGIVLDVRWRCASFTQAARLVDQGICGAILPEIAARFLAGDVKAYDLPWLKGYRRKIGFAWHQRVVDARPTVAKIIGLFLS